MPNLNRRRLFEVASAGAIMGTMNAFTPHGIVRAESESKTVFHVFLFQWKPETSSEQKARAVHDIRAFQGAIPGLLQTHVGPNMSPRGGPYTFGGIMEFKDQESLVAYVQHPSHQALLLWLKPLINAIELDVQT